MALRSPDPPGAFSAIAEDPELVDLLVQWPDPKNAGLWQQLVEKLLALAEAQRCVKCGTCCRVSSPTLYLRDLASIRAGHLPLANLFTIRAGEIVHSRRLDQTLLLGEELLKLRERPQGGCLQLDDHLCRDYDNRPLQCRHLECWSGRHAGDLAEEPRLTRRDVFAGDDVALGLIEEYEQILPARALHEALEAAREGDEEATAVALAFIERDHRLRAAIGERYGYSPRKLELVLGRDAVVLVRAQGLMINLDDEQHPSFVSR